METLEGGCLCGAVRYRATSPVKTNYCHCRLCQRSAGAPVPDDANGLGDDLVRPQRLEQLALGGHPVVVLDQITEHGEDLGLERNHFIAVPQLIELQIERELAEGVHGEPSILGLLPIRVVFWFTKGGACSREREVAGPASNPAVSSTARA